MFNIFRTKAAAVLAAALLTFSAFAAPGHSPVLAAGEDSSQGKTGQETAPSAERDYNYTEIAGSVTITEYKGSSAVVEIPETLDGKPVTRIGAAAFANNAALTSVKIPEGVTAIEDGTYSNATETPSTGAFYNCKSLSEVSLPNSLANIGSLAFAYCDSLGSVTIPANVTAIGMDAFSYSGLASITLKDGLKTIGASAFAGSKLLKADIPDSVTSIGSGAFADCKLLSSVKLPSNITEVSTSLFSECSALASIKIPDAVTKISYDAFYGCTALNAIEWGANVTDIAAGAFYGCTALESVNLPAKLTAIGAITGGDTGENSGSASEDKTQTDGTTKPERLPLGAFEKCTSLKSVSMPESLTSVGSCTFAEDTSLETLVFPSKLEKIGERIINGCTKLKSAEFLGNAPVCEDADRSGAVEPLGQELPSGYVTLYQKGATGFKDPWYGWPAREKSSLVESNLLNSIKVPNVTINGQNINISINKEISIGGKLQTVITGLPRTALNGTLKAEDIKKLFNPPNGTSLEIVNPEGVVIASGDLVGTGAMVRLKNSSGDVIAENSIIVPGDITGSGKVGIADYGNFKGAWTGKLKLNDIENEAADINGDGRVSLSDVALMRAIIIEKII